MELRGFDQYEITLGDEMRGERACLGKTLKDAERDLCIKADMLAAIENSEIEAFPNRSVVPGYVRSYARYLGMNPDRCYDRFCAESGFQSSLATFGMVPDPSGQPKPGVIGAALAGSGAGLTESRFAMRPAPRRIGARISFGGLASTAVLFAIVGGLGYGGYALLQDIQRVGFAPLPEAPAVVADAPAISAPELEIASLPRPDATVYSGGGALAQVALPSDLPPAHVRRDGPISAINPATSGIFRVAREEEAESEVAAAAPGFDHSAEGIRPPAPVAMMVSTIVEEPATAAMAADVPQTVTLRATDKAWVRVRDGDDVVVFEGILTPGQSFEIPERLTAPVLRAGNAGGVYVTVGATPYGPIGLPGRVVKNVSLLADDVVQTIPEARIADLEDAAPDGTLRSAAADISR